MDRRAWKATVHRVTKNQSDTTEHVSMKENKVHHYNHNKGLSCQFPGAQSASFLFSTLKSFRGCWRSAAAEAHDLILVEIEGKQPWQLPIGGWQTSLELQNWILPWLCEPRRGLHDSHENADWLTSSLSFWVLELMTQTHCIWTFEL